MVMKCWTPRVGIGYEKVGIVSLGRAAKMSSNALPEVWMAETPGAGVDDGKVQKDAKVSSGMRRYPWTSTRREFL